jgi:hypothetical protein
MCCSQQAGFQERREALVVACGQLDKLARVTNSSYQSNGRDRFGGGGNILGNITCNTWRYNIYVV